MKNSEVIIRAYEASDLHALSTIWFEASRRVHSFLGDDRLRNQRKLVESVYLPESETWVATCNGAPVGFIGLIDAFIGALFVSTELQGGGIGRALVAHALQLKRELELEVYTANESARSFYERLGFVEVSRTAEDAEGLPFEVVRMRLMR
ncbi:GNAT family N-acetyltransferase [Bradyrhizobium sp. AS23.2]|uniref:GNAT family N-acetyltransferase n=1 Tax=Bradyrhizobium sp. AS23.2 TaxID=1680155 RepID=UPI00093A693E|nr:GNAT family N-acetyltransferase [Bradyrhizobium sp. AS23.2]OKO84992.1 acetyltransferase [Bradyrhizobium sp. AS23.2]